MIGVTDRKTQPACLYSSIGDYCRAPVFAHLILPEVGKVKVNNPNPARRSEIPGRKDTEAITLA